MNVNDLIRRQESDVSRLLGSQPQPQMNVNNTEIEALTNEGKLCP